MSQFDRVVGTYCSDPRCTTTQTCQRERHERYGNAPGENYGPRCVPLPPPARTAEEERAAVVAWLRDVAQRDWDATTAYSMTRAVEAIERGDHRQGKP